MVDNTVPRIVKFGTSRFGYDLVVERCRSGKFYEVKLMGGGDQPAEFAGFFTSFNEASSVANGYLIKIKKEPADIGTVPSVAGKKYVKPPHKQYKQRQAEKAALLAQEELNASDS